MITKLFSFSRVGSLQYSSRGSNPWKTNNNIALYSIGYKFPIGQRRWMIRNSWLYSIKCLDGHSGGYLQVKSNLSLEKFTILRTRSLATTWTRKVECYSSEPAVNYVTQCRIDRTKLPNRQEFQYSPLQTMTQNIFFAISQVFWWYIHIRRELRLVTSLIVFVRPDDDP